MKKSTYLVVSLRAGSGLRWVLVDQCHLVAEMNAGQAERLMLRERFNPDIRTSFVKAPEGTTAERWIIAFNHLEPSERASLYEAFANKETSRHEDLSL